MKNISLEETSEYLEGKGIINILTTLFPDLPWKNKIDGVDLDLDYYLNHSGNKLVSRLVEKLLNDDDELTTESLVKLATIIYRKYGDSWKRVFSAFDLQYNPIWNKDYTESFTDTETSSGSKTDNTIYGKVITNGGTRNISETGTDNTEHTNTNYQEKTEFGKVVSNGGTKSIAETGTDNTEHTNTNYQEKTEFGKSVTDKLTFPETRTSTTTKNGTKTNTQSFGSGNNAYKETTENLFGINAEGSESVRKTTNKKTGQMSIEHESDSNDPYVKNVDSWGNVSTKNRINAFNSGMKESSDTTTYTSGENGSGESGNNPSGVGGNGIGTHQRTAESGKYSDTTTYGSGDNAFKDETTETGAETQHVTKSGQIQESEGFTDYSDVTTEAGSEQHKIDDSGDETLKITGSKSDNETKNLNTVETDNLTQTDSGDETLKITGSKSDNETKNLNTLETNNLTETASGTDTISGTESGSRNLAHEFTGQGNIGITTTQQLLTSEVELRKMYSSLFDTVVYPDLDKVLVLALYKKGE